MTRRDAFRLLGAAGVALAGCKSEEEATADSAGDLNLFGGCGHYDRLDVSFLSTVTRRFGLTPLNARVSAANDVRDCIDRDALETASTPSPIKLANVSLSESRVHESIRESRGQSELADIRWGGPATLEMKRRATSEMLGVFDRLGVANIRG